MLYTSVRAYDKEQSENEARVIGARWFGCRPEEVMIQAIRTESETEYAETSDMATTYAYPTSTVYYTEYRIFGPGEF